MKILYLAAANSIHSYRWIKYFAHAGHDIAWISLAPSIFEPIQGVYYFEINRELGPFSLVGAVNKIRRILGQFKPDVLHVHSVGTYGMMGLLSGFNPIIATPWGSDIILNKKSPLKRFFISRILKRAKVITCDALHMRDEIMQFGVSADRIHIINFGIDTIQFSPGPPSPTFQNMINSIDSTKVISLRSFELIYDIETLLRAIPKVLDRCPTTRFILVGKGSLEKELKSLTSKLQIDHAVSFIGFLANEKLIDALRSVDIYVSTSLSDAGISASTAEAMACGLPVIVTDSGENARWINDGENGYIIPIREFEALADRIIALIENPELRQRFGRAGRETIRQRNDYQDEMLKMGDLYSNFLRK